MTDPLPTLLNSLHAVFVSQTLRNGKYLNREIQQLKDALSQYSPNEQVTVNNSAATQNFMSLVHAVGAALPHFQRRKIGFEVIKKSLDELALRHNAHIDWQMFLTHPKVSPKFKFSALNHSRPEDDLLVWIAAKKGVPTKEQLKISLLIDTMVEYSEAKTGFSEKLSTHLVKDPEFLFNLIIKSAKNFDKVLRSKLILFLTDEQIATAIIHHIPPLDQNSKGLYEQVERLINTLNQQLSNGRSVSTLMRNLAAHDILVKGSELFQYYQSGDYKQYKNPPSIPDQSEAAESSPRIF